MDKDIIKGNWLKAKGYVKQKWGKLTDDDVTEANGNWDILIGKIQAKYGYEKDKARGEVRQWLEENEYI